MFCFFLEMWVCSSILWILLMFNNIWMNVWGIFVKWKWIKWWCFFVNTHGMPNLIFLLGTFPCCILLSLDVMSNQEPIWVGQGNIYMKIPKWKWCYHWRMRYMVFSILHQLFKSPKKTDLRWIGFCLNRTKV